MTAISVIFLALALIYGCEILVHRLGHSSNRGLIVNIPVISAVVYAISLLYGCGITGSGDIVTMNKEINDFEKVKIANSCEADIEYADSFSVKISIDDNLTNDLIVNQSNGGLTIKMGRGNFRRFTCIADITMPAFTKLMASDAARIEIAGFELDKPAKITAEDAANVVGQLNAKTLTVEVYDASRVNLKGGAEALTLRVEDASRADLENFPIKTANVTLDDASNAIIDVSDTLGVTARDASSLSYFGTPVIKTMRVSDASRVKSKN